MSSLCGRRWRLLLLLGAACCLSLLVPGWTAAPLSAASGTDRVDGAPLDVFGVAVKPTCINRAAITALRRHLRPRSIHVVTVTARQCAAFESWAPNVCCHLQDGFLPNVTKAAVAAQLDALHNANGGGQFRGRDLSGWYLQQFLKLGAAGALPGLSEHFLIWDLDMVPLRPLRLFWPPPPGAPAGAPVQNVVNIGGANAQSYADTYSRLFRQPLLAAPDGSSFVTHWMVVYKPYMAAFLDDIATAQSAAQLGNGDPRDGGASPALGDGSASEVAGSAAGAVVAAAGMPRWVEAILAALPDGKEDIQLGFSEYASYVSWARYRHPGSQRLAAKRTWLRYGVGGGGAIRLLRHASRDGVCCPTVASIAAARLLGYTYTGYDVGHVLECRYADAAHSEAYGVPI